MANGNVQQVLVTDWGFDDGNTRAETVTQVSLANSYARLANILFSSAGPTAGTSGSRGMADISCTCLLSADDTVSLNRRSAGIDEDVSVAIEVIEYPASGPDAVIVRMHENILISGGTLLVNEPILNVGTLANCVPVICGLSAATTSASYDRGSVTAEIVFDSGDKLRLERGDNSGDVLVSVAVLEFTGSNWSVQQNIPHSQSVSAAIETEPISSVVWDETMIFTSGQDNSANIDGNIIAAWPGAATTVKCTALATSGDAYFIHLVSNPNMDVEHIDSFDGSEAIIDTDGSNPYIEDIMVTASALADHSIIVSGMSIVSTQAVVKVCWNYYLTSTTNLRFWVARTDTNSDFEWAAQLIDISGLLEGGAVVITDVDGDEAWDDGDTGLVITGTGFV